MLSSAPDRIFGILHAFGARGPMRQPFSGQVLRGRVMGSSLSAVRRTVVSEVGREANGGGQVPGTGSGKEQIAAGRRFGGWTERGDSGQFPGTGSGKEKIGAGRRFGGSAGSEWRRTVSGYGFGQKKDRERFAVIRCGVLFRVTGYSKTVVGLISTVQASFTWIVRPFGIRLA